MGSPRLRLPVRLSRGLFKDAQEIGSSSDWEWGVGRCSGNGH